MVSPRSCRQAADACPSLSNSPVSGCSPTKDFTKEGHATPPPRPPLSPSRCCQPLRTVPPQPTHSRHPAREGVTIAGPGDLAGSVLLHPRHSRRRRRRSGRKSRTPRRPRLLGKVGSQASSPVRRAAISRGRSVTVATKADQLSGIDHDIVGLLQAHRVLTTPQLITLTGRPERTIDYRLGRLRARSLVNRSRPYTASGSAPFFWWLTRSAPAWSRAPHPPRAKRRRTRCSSATPQPLPACTSPSSTLARSSGWS